MLALLVLVLDFDGSDSLIEETLKARASFSPGRCIGV